MPSLRPRRSLWIIPALALSLLIPSHAFALRVVSWNILNYPAASGASREDDHRVVIAALHPDVLVVQEVTGTTSAGQNQYLNNVLNVVFPGEYVAGPWINGPDTNNALFYRPAAITLVSNQNIATSLRDISEYVVRPVGYSASAASVRVYSFHLKAGSSSSDQTQRTGECTILRNHANALPAGTNFLFAGDYNMQSSSETAYGVLTGSQADNDGRGFDPINMPGSWNNNASFAAIHTQSPRTTSLGDGGATGGMDDRFDIILSSTSLLDGEGLAYIPGTYKAYGNDGQHLNKDLTDSPTIPEGAAMALALRDASDHLPVIMDFQLPARVSAVASLNFGTVIIGASASQTLNVSNGAAVPADELNYTLTSPVGFTSPGGGFIANAGAGANAHSIGMLTGTAGNKNGTLVINSDDVDDPAKNVTLSGTVLRHAVPAATAGGATSDTLDFGVHDIGSFSDQAATVRNIGYDALQALLNVYAAGFSGPDAGRFSIAGGFSAANVNATPAAYNVHFDDTGATAGATYTATLTISTRDQQGLAGATNLSSVVYHLTAEVSNVSAAPDPVAFRTRLIGNAPNPFNPVTMIAFEIGQAGSVRLNIYDVRGRLVARIADSVMEAGRYNLGWDGLDDQGASLGSGVYFYQLEAPGRTETKSMTMLK